MAATVLTAAVLQGAAAIRVHEVGPARQAMLVAEALRAASELHVREAAC